MTTTQLTEQDIEEMKRLRYAVHSYFRAGSMEHTLAMESIDKLADLRRLRAENERLARENGRLEADYLHVADSIAPSSGSPQELSAQVFKLRADLTAATERAERAEATVRELRAAYGVSETQQEADRDQFMASVESATAEQIAAWIEQRAEAIGTGRDELTGSEAARELALCGAVEQIRAGAWRKEQP